MTQGNQLGQPSTVVSAALAAFGARETPPLQRRDALSSLIETKALPREAEAPEVLQGRRMLIEMATSAEPITRLMGIAESVRLGQVVKRWGAQLPRDLAPALQTEIPPAQLLAEASDRLNLARACAMMDSPWLPKYLAAFVAEEETGEKARAQALAALLDRVVDLEELLNALSHAFSRYTPQTEAPGETVARRLTRTLAAIRELLVDTEKEPGRNFGGAFERLLSESLAGRQPQTEKVKIELAREALLALHDALRTQATLIVDASAYAVTSYCRRLCGGPTWPSELQRPLEKLVLDVSQALLLMGRQGERSQEMLEQLKAVTNYPERAQAISRSLAEKHEELSEEVRDWLVHGRIRVHRGAGAALIEVAASNADEALGLALQESRRLRALVETLNSPLLSNLQLLDATLASACKDLLEQASRTSVQVEQAAVLRNLDLVGKPGEEIEASSKYFRVMSEFPKAKMTVRQPAVVRKRPDGGPGEVIVKGLLE
jgi:hypothetical protein